MDSIEETKHRVQVGPVAHVTGGQTTIAKSNVAGSTKKVLAFPVNRVQPTFGFAAAA